MQRCFHSVEWLSGVSACPVLFKELSKFDHVCGSESGHEQRTSEKGLMLLIRLEKFTKLYLKEFGLYKSTVRQIVNKWMKFKTTVSFPRSTNKDHSKTKQSCICPPTKITPKARHVIVGEVAKDSKGNSKQLEAFLTLADNKGSWVHRQENTEQSRCAVCSLLKIMWTSQRAIGEMFNGRMRPK